MAEMREPRRGWRAYHDWETGMVTVSHQRDCGWSTEWSSEQYRSLPWAEIQTRLIDHERDAHPLVVPDSELTPETAVAGTVRDGRLYLVVRCPVCQRSEDLLGIVMTPVLRSYGRGGGTLSVETGDIPVMAHTCTRAGSASSRI